MRMNRMANCKNMYQGRTKKVLCVCSAGLLRSPTAAHILSAEPFNFNTRAAGLSKEYALIPVDEVLIAWADEIVCMEPDQAEALARMTDKPIICLDVEDTYEYRSGDLIREIEKKYPALLKELEATP